jgi:crotonobetainyl-CoA:carnitine CoA-transferase CaiB-like acyl-CoA transferase
MTATNELHRRSHQPVASGSRPLAGIRVLDLGNYIAGPGTAMILGELGADVIKIEALTGDIARHVGAFGAAMIHCYNRDKRSIAIELREPRGLAVVKKLIGRSDVVVQNLRPGLVDALGIGAAAMRAVDPRLIYLSVSGFGVHGPSRGRPGLDIAAQAESGLMSVTGEPDRPPQKVGVPIIDAATTHVGAQAVLAALFKRERTGEGETIETSLLEVAIHLQASTWSQYATTGREPTRQGSGQVSNAPAAELIRTADGWIVLSAYTEEHWARLCKTLGRETLITDERFATSAARVKNKPAMLAELENVLSPQSSTECVELLSKNGIVVAAVRTYSQARVSPDVEAAGIFMQTTGDNGAEMLGLPYRFAGGRATTAGAPAIGQHSLAILSELGFDAREVEAMIKDGIVGGA